MNKYYDAIQNPSGDILANHRVQVLDSGGSIVTIYADSSGTRFKDSDNNNINYATTDPSNGLVEFYWTAATGQTLQVLDTTGELVLPVADFANNFSTPDAVVNVDTVLGVPASGGDLGDFTGGTIASDQDVKNSLQDLETALEKSASSTISNILVAATSNVTLSGEQTIDGQTTLTSRVLLTGQTDASENGVWTTAAGAWARYGEPSHASGLLCTVLKGIEAGQWKLTTTGTITVGTTDLNFVNVLPNSAARIALASDQTVQTALDYRVSFSDFPGFDPTGVADQTATLAAAHASGGNVIDFPTGTYSFPTGFPAHSDMTYRFNGSTIKGDGTTVGIYNGSTRADRSKFYDGWVDGYTEGLSSMKMSRNNFYSMTTANCDIGWALRVGSTGESSYYNNFFGCHNHYGTTIGLKTFDGSYGGPNTNFFHGCLIYGDDTCADLAKATNLAFYGGSIESGSADHLLKMDGTLRSVFLGVRLEGKVGAIIDIKAASQDNGFLYCTISGSNVLTDNGTRTTFIGGKLSAWTHQFGFTLLPGNQYAYLGSDTAEDLMWEQVNAKVLRLYGVYSAFQAKSSYSDANPRFAFTSTGKIDWGPGTTAADCTMYRQSTGVMRHSFRLEPVTDNDVSSGSGSKRYTTINLATAPTVTSDEREKVDIGPIEDAILRAWAKVDYLKYRLKDDVKKDKKGARWHFGVIAQRVKEAFESEGLDPFKLAILSYHEWPEEPAQEAVYENVSEIDTPEKEAVLDKDGAEIEPAQPPVYKTVKQLVSPAVKKRPAGNRYAILYDEATALENMLARSERAALSKRLDALEKALK